MRYSKYLFKRTLFLLSVAYIFIFISGCQITIEERCEKWLKIRESCSPQESDNPLEMLQTSLECHKKALEKAVDKLNQQEKEEFMSYCNKKMLEPIGEALEGLKPGKIEQQNKAYLESTKDKVLGCKKYLPSLKKFCPRAYDVEPGYLSYQNPPPFLAPLMQNSKNPELESCSWRVDIGADPMRSASSLEMSSLIVSISVYPSIEVAADQFSLIATETKKTIDLLDSCEGEVQDNFLHLSCSSKLNSPGEEGKLLKDMKVQQQKDNWIISAEVDFGEDKQPVCDLSQLTALVQSI